MTQRGAGRPRGAIELDRMTWPEIEADLKAGRDTIVVAFGATEPIHPELVHLERGEPGYTGDTRAAMGAIFTVGVHSIAPNGVIGDPTEASVEHGNRYWNKALDVALAEIDS